MNPAEPSGLHPATVTPFDANFAIDYQALENHLGLTADSRGVQGLTVNGHLGELLALSPKERAEVITVAKRSCSEDQVVYGGIFGYHVEDMVEQGLRAKAAGADGLLVLPPVDIRPYRRLASNPESVLHFFAELDTRVGLPMIVHQYPTFTGAAYSLEVLGRLVELENVVAVKAASVDIADYTTLWHELSEKTHVLVATDAPGMLGMLLCGAHGALIGIAAIVPELWANLLDLVENGPLDQARDLFVRSCLPLMEAVFENQVPRGLASEASATKEALVQLGQLPSSRVRLPAVEVSSGRKRAIQRALVRAGLLADDATDPVAG
jgi:4-hydroxy-tetrahydrodipicolinate synthase